MGRLFEHNDRFLKTNLYQHTAFKVKNSINALCSKKVVRPEVDAFIKELATSFEEREKNGENRDEVMIFEGKI